MNKTRKPDKNEARNSPLSITAEEFDAKFDAGEDVSGYVDWDNGVLVEPGELSPGQKLSMEMLAEAGMPDDNNDEFTARAIQRGVSQEEMAQLLIVRQLELKKVSP